ncbi:UDP-2,4-diacetamido-2,4,6-trideoxy-beta-L-altropyranose hydrolase [Vibrio breoganii]|uniref:UDP-2,4-diacetamido-2,4, 6-trideoxy-beta-L-altropyranose hydrolase n=1 Tax=Vibrio breoganii TaxID=553239 RepID=UPI000C81B59A|nr:UDP-2,4-diacetamido-2,4,6-trideoxy-beta-L-altropyranose hydrolase [Vibrio breoganii]PMO91539.1 UDP-2,4-diacetamido-2,4,6-trideoxy-beta-L-altropyranose hydrolase [Vibrio breoganii]
MHVAIRVDASLKMGTGHTYRMLTLADKLSMLGHNVYFIARELNGNLLELIKKRYQCIELSKPEKDLALVDSQGHCFHASWLEVPYQREIDESFQAALRLIEQLNLKRLDWIVVDNYAIEKKWHESLSSLSNNILQIDDLADRGFFADVVLDQNYYLQGKSRYSNCVDEQTKLLCGPSFALLRDEFSLARAALPTYQTRRERKHVVLFFGGIDIANETLKALKGLLKADSDDYFDVIIGMNNPHKTTLEEYCSLQERVTLHIQVSNMTDYFSKAYLYVGAVGATTWERCVMALPGIVCSVADNQEQVAKDLHQIDGHFYLGKHHLLTEESYRVAYEKFLKEPDLLTKQSSNCASLVDGIGAERVCKILEDMANA